MRTVFGIHVGNSRACLAMCKRDDREMKMSIEIIANNDGEQVTPAIVTVTENECVVGTSSKSLLVSRWNTTILFNKRMLNRYTPDATNGNRTVSTTLRDGELCYVLPLEDRTEYMTPMDIAGHIYHSLYEIARSAMPGDESEASCVLLLPKHFSEEAVFKARTAAETAGWDVMQVISEPAATVQGFRSLTKNEHERVLVYRVGGRTCDVTVLEVNKGMLTLLGMENSEEVGGKLLIETLTRYLAGEFYRRYKLDPKESHRSLTKLTLAAENCLHVLSTIESANCFVESLCEGVDFSHQMSRARFESLLSPFLPKFAEPLHSLLSKHNLTPGDISKVLLSGGPMKIPRLRKYISEIFEGTDAKIVPLPNGLNYDEVLAFGAAIHAGLIVENNMGNNFLPQHLDIPVLDFPVTFTVEGATCETLVLDPGQPLPVHRTLQITSPQELVTVRVTQPESNETVLAGQLQLENLSDPVNLEIEVDSENGIKVKVPDENGISRHHTIRMFSCPINLQQ